MKYKSPRLKKVMNQEKRNMTIMHPFWIFPLVTILVFLQLSTVQAKHLWKRWTKSFPQQTP